MVLETLILIASGKISTHKKMHKTNGDICFNRNLQKKIVLHHFSYLFKQLFTTYLWIVIKDNLVLLQD